MTMVLKCGVKEMSLSQTNIQLEQINEPSGRSVHSYTPPNYVCFRCHRTSSPNYPCLLIGLLYTNFTRINSSSDGRSSAIDCFTIAATPFLGPEQPPEQYLFTPCR